MTDAQQALAAADWIRAREPHIPPPGQRPAYEFRTQFDLAEEPRSA